MGKCGCLNIVKIKFKYLYFYILIESKMVLNDIKSFLGRLFFKLKRFVFKKVNYLKLYINYVFDFIKFKKYSKKNNRFILNWKNRWPILYDKTVSTGFCREYIYHTGWASRVLANTKPEIHTDISSSLYFVSIASAFVPIDFYDYRPANLDLNNVKSKQGDLMNLPFNDFSIKSLSCMHVVEHVGLGRYGDSIDSQGDLKAIKELQRVLAKDGNLLFVVPMGKPQIKFNAHRVYSYDQIINYFSDLKCKQFVLIPENPDDGGLVYNPSQELIKKQQQNACGCFWFTREI